MRKTSSLILLTAIICLLAGCASTPKAPKAADIQLSEAEARAAIDFAMSEVRVPAKVMDFFPILTQTDKVNISWTSSDKKILWFDFKFIEVKPAPQDTVVTLTATFECSGYTAEKSYDVLVYGEDTFLSDDDIQEMLFEVTVADFDFGDSYMNLGEQCHFWDHREWENRAMRLSFNPHYRIDDAEHFRVYDNGEVWVDSHSLSQDYRTTLNAVYQVEVRDQRSGEEHAFTTKTKKIELCAPKMTHFETPDWSMDIIGDTMVFQEHRQDWDGKHTRGTIYQFTEQDGVITTRDVASRENESEEWFYFADMREYSRMRLDAVISRYEELSRDVPGMERVYPEEAMGWNGELNGTMQEQGFGDYTGDYFVNETDMAIFLGMDPAAADDWGKAYDFIIDMANAEPEFFKLEVLRLLEDWRLNMAAFLKLPDDTPASEFHALLPGLIEAMNEQMYPPRKFTYRASVWYDWNEGRRYADLCTNELWNESRADWWEQNGEWRWSANEWDGDVWRVEAWGICHETRDEDGDNWHEDRWDGHYSEDYGSFEADNGDIYPLSFDAEKRTLTIYLPDGPRELNFQGYGIF